MFLHVFDSGFRPTNQTTQYDDSSRSRHVTDCVVEVGGLELIVTKDAQGKGAFLVAVYKGHAAVVERLMRTRAHGRPRTAGADYGTRRLVLGSWIWGSQRAFLNGPACLGQRVTPSRLSFLQKDRRR